VKECRPGSFNEHGSAFRRYILSSYASSRPPVVILFSSCRDLHFLRVASSMRRFARVTRDLPRGVPQPASGGPPRHARYPKRIRAIMRMTGRGTRRDSAALVVPLITSDTASARRRTARRKAVSYCFSYRLRMVLFVSLRSQAS